MEPSRPIKVVYWLNGDGQLTPYKSTRHGVPPRRVVITGLSDLEGKPINLNQDPTAPPT